MSYQPTFHHNSTYPVSEEIRTFYGITTGSSGTFTLLTDIIVGSGVTKIVIPKGMSVKIWSREVSGASGAISVNYQYASNGVSFQTLVTDVLPSAGELDIEKRHPHKFTSSAGTEAIQLTYSGATAGQTVTFDLAFVQDD